MKVFKRFLCGVALSALALGAGAVLLNAKKEQGFVAHAEVVTEEPAGILHLDEAKIKGYENHYFETMVGPLGQAVTAYVFTANGDCAKNPEVRWVVPGAGGDVKVAYPEAVTSVSFWYKLVNESEKNAADASVPYLTQVIESTGAYPIYTFSPVKDGAWHFYSMSVLEASQNIFDGFIIKAGDIKGSLTVANIKINTAETDIEPVSELHLDQEKVKKVSARFENMAGHDGNQVTAYVFEGTGGLGLDGTLPEIRFMNAQSGGSTKIASVTPVTRVHFWYKLTNSSEADSEQAGSPYLLQVVKAPSGYPFYNFSPVNDGEWHPFLMEITAEDSTAFAGFLVEFGDLNGEFVLANIELNGNYTKDLTNMIAFKNMGDNYDYLDNLFVNFTFSEKIFGANAYLNDHYAEFVDADGQVIDLLHGIKINDKTLYYWTREYNASGIHEQIVDDTRVMAFPMTVGNNSVYAPVAAEIRVNSSDIQEIDFKVNLDVFPMDSLKITFVSGVFRGYYNGIDYELSEDVTFYYTLPANSAEFTAATMSRTPNEEVVDFGILNVDDWSAGQGHPFYVIWTNIPRNEELVHEAWFHDHYRYLFCDIIMNGVTLNDHNCWARGNNKDFSAAGVWNEDYNTFCHPTGTPAWNYDYATQPHVVTDQANYVFMVETSVQFMADRNITTPEFSLREGMLLQSKDAQGNALLVRYQPTVMAQERATLKAEIENYKDAALYTRVASEYNAIIADAKAALDAMHYESGLAAIVADAKAQLDALKADAEIEGDAQAAAEAFAQQFISTVGGVCDANGATNRDQLDAAWAQMASAFNSLSNHAATNELAQNLLRDAEKSQSSALGRFADLYEYIVEKYGSAAYADFAGRFGGQVVPPASGTTSISFPSIMSANNNAIIIIVVAAVIAASSVGAFFVIRRRRNAK